MAEYWDVYDENRVAKGRLHKRGVKLKQGDYHVICEAWLTCGDKLLVTRRHPDKNWGGLWECTGGAVKAGENSLQAIKREISEEIGLDVEDDELIFMGTAQGSTVFIDCYTINRRIDLNMLILQPEEVSDAKLVTYDEFMKMYRDRQLIPHIYSYMRQMGFRFVNQRKRYYRRNQRRRRKN